MDRDNLRGQSSENNDSIISMIILIDKKPRDNVTDNVYCTLTNGRKGHGHGYIFSFSKQLQGTKRQ